VTLQLSNPLGGDASVAALLPGAAGMAAKRGLTWRGQTWDNSTDGTPAGAVAEAVLSPTSPGVFDVTLPAAAALIITLPPVEPSPPSPPPPPPQPPSPPQPPATAAPALRVSARVAVGGYSIAAFGATQQAAFGAALASRLGVASADVAVTGILDYVSSRRRTLLASSSVEVSFDVAAKDGAAADALKAGITSATSGAGATALLTALQGAGLSAATSLQLTAPPTSAPASAAARSGDMLLVTALTIAVML
jgi:hypothetical protein